MRGRIETSCLNGALIVANSQRQAEEGMCTGEESALPVALPERQYGCSPESRRPPRKLNGISIKKFAV